MYTMPTSELNIFEKRTLARHINNNLDIAIERNIDNRQLEPFSPDVQLPWSCESLTVWRDLGADHHPRHIREEQCVNSTCWYGHYRCLPVKYPTKVLVRNMIGVSDGKLPVELRADWRFQTHEITVGCVCSR